MQKTLILCGIPLVALAAFISFSKITHGDTGHIEVQSNGAKEGSGFFCVNRTMNDAPSMHLFVDDKNQTMSVNYDDEAMRDTCPPSRTRESLPAQITNGVVFVEYFIPTVENCFFGNDYYRIFLHDQRRSAVRFLTVDKPWDEASEQEKAQAQDIAFHYSCFPEGKIAQ